ncbi:MAG TPA: GNAT family N-acetyltransferase [Chitinophagaceae bacterium]|nr:GNAT family N-acetyltransferase [Chitinophagaceae bacterium]
MVELRPWRWSDSKKLTHLINNRKIWDNVRDHLPHPYSYKDADLFLQHNVDQVLQTNFAVLKDGEIIGGVGYIPKDDVYKFTAEIGYWIGEPYWGQGLATEAIRLLVKKIREQSPLIVRVYAEVFDYNIASMRVLEKNGFYQEAIRRKGVVKNGIIRDDHVFVLLL